MASREIEDRFLETYLRDANRDRVRSLEEYQALFPGHEAAIAREYRLLEVDEDGDPGRVYLARDPRVRWELPLKIVETSRFGLDVEVRMRRFRREAELAARLDHPGICGVLDVGEDTAAGVVYIAMRFLEGRTLAEWIEQEAGRDTGSSVVELPASEDSSASATGERRVRRSGDRQLRHVLGVIEKVARALHVAHEQGLVHRDIKPGNIMIGPAGEPVILDFGLARDAGSDALGLTLSGDVLGTPYYMSPEQVRGEHAAIDRRTDVYSLGVVLYECLTRRRPFAAQSREDLYREIQHEPPADPRRLNGAIPRDLKIVLDTALDKERERRYPTALAFAEDLCRVLRLQPITARPLPWGLRAQRWVQRNRVVATFLAVLVVALAWTFWLLDDLQATNVDLTAKNRSLERSRIADTLQQIAADIEAGQPWQVDERRRMLETVPEERRGYAWAWLDARRAPPPPLFTCSSPVLLRDIEFDPDGRSLLAIRQDVGEGHWTTSIGDGQLHRLSLATNAWSLPIAPAFCVELTPDRRWIVVGSLAGRNVRVLDAKTLALACERLHDAPVSAVCCSRDGRIASAGRDGSLRIWRIDHDGDRMSLVDATPQGLVGFGQLVRGIDFSPDGRRLVIAGDRMEAWLVDLAHPRQEPCLLEFFTAVEKEHEKRALYAFARTIKAKFSPDGRVVVVVGRRGAVRLFDGATGGLRAELRPHRSEWAFGHPSTDACFDPTGRLLITVGFDNVLQVHDVRSGQRLGHIATGGFAVAAALSADGTRVAVAESLRIDSKGPARARVWHFGDIPIPNELVGSTGHHVQRVLTTADRRFAFAADRQSVRKFDLATGRTEFALRDPRGPMCIALRPGDRELAIGYETGHCEVVDARTGKLLRRFRADKKLVWPDYDHMPTGFLQLAYHPRGDWLVGGLGSVFLGLESQRPVPLLVLDADSLRQLRRVDGHRTNVMALAFDREGARLASSGGEGRVCIWDTRTWQTVGEARWRLSGGTLAQAPDGVLWHWPERGVLASIDPRSGRETGRAEVPAGPVAAMEFGDNGLETVLGLPGRVAIWDAPLRHRLLTLPVRFTAPSAGDVTWNGRHAVLAGGTRGELWYHEVRPAPEQFGRRQVEWAANRRVQELLYNGETVAGAGRIVTRDPLLPPAVREAALRCLAVTSENPIPALAMGHLRLNDPLAETAEIETVRRRMRDLEAWGQALRGDDAHAWREHRAVVWMVMGRAYDRLGQHRDAVELLERAASAPRSDYPEFNSHDVVRDLHSAPSFFRAAAARRAKDRTAEQESLEQAWAAGIGGILDEQAMAHCYGVLDIRARRPDGATGAAWLATGPPDANRNGKNVGAWYPDAADSGSPVLELRYAQAVPAAELRVYEVNVPGAVVAVELRGPGGRDHAWEVENHATHSGIFTIRVPPEADFPADVVRLRLDPERRKGWNGIDTVRLVPRDGLRGGAWPVAARVVGSR